MTVRGVAQYTERRMTGGCGENPRPIPEKYNLATVANLTEESDEDSMTKAIWDLPTREEHLLRVLQQRLHAYKNMERPLKASEMLVPMPTDELAEIMAWAEVALRDWIITKRNHIDNEAVAMRPYALDYPSNKSETEK